MIPTFVITLREGVEASLIVGIIAAFLVKEGRQDALRQMWVGVAIAIVLCSAVGIALDVVGEELPQKQQEGLETVVGLIAVATISYMIIWMTRHSREIKAELEGGAASALAHGSAHRCPSASRCATSPGSTRTDLATAWRSKRSSRE